jgi:hypothetical protein
VKLFRKNEVTGQVEECHCPANKQDVFESCGWTTDSSGKPVAAKTDKPKTGKE